MIFFDRVKKRKGQAVNQVFVYITASVIFGMVLLFGYSAVQSFLEDSDYVALISLKTNLESSINNIASTQDKENKMYRVPDGYDKICFIDMNSYPGDTSCASMDLPGIICNAWKDNVTQSIMLAEPMSQITINTVAISVYDENDVEVGAHCLDISRGIFKLQLKGESNKAKIRPLIE